MAEDLKQLRARLDGLKTQRAKDEGALEQTMKRLKDEFGCKDLDAARKLYATLRAENEQAEQAIETQATELDALINAMEQDVAGR